MTAIRSHSSHTGVSSQVYVWRCEACRCVHVRAGEVLLTFTPAEFADFAESIGDCYWQQQTLGASDDTALVEVLGVKPDSESEALN